MNRFYSNWLNKKHKKKLDDLLKKGYNIYGISEYASTALADTVEPIYYEAYTEYRVLRLFE